MDQVYRNASNTIVNAAGEGPDCGLPGVSDCPRVEQRFLEVHGVRYFTLPCPKLDLVQSSWAQRGCISPSVDWKRNVLTLLAIGTYQEGLLSRRRILFSKHQVSFRCLRTHGCEAIPGIYKLIEPSWTRKVLSIDERSQMQAFPILLNAPTDWLELSSRDPTLTAWIARRINEYIGRSLSCEPDILNAFMGVLRQAWFLPEPIYHFWGLPFLSESTSDEPTKSDVLRAIMWQAQHVSQLRGPVLASRRDTFSSWTWAGWRNPGEFCTSRVQRLEGGITLEDGDSTRLDLQKYMSRMYSSWNMLAFKPVLYVTGWFAAIHFAFKSFRMVRRVAAFTRGANGVEEGDDKFSFARVEFIHGDAYLESLTQGKSQPPLTKWLAIMFTQTKNTDNSDGTISNAHGLLLKETRDGELEKVVVFSFCVDDLLPSDQAQVDRRRPHEASKFAVLLWVWRRPGNLTGTLRAEWQTIKLF